MPARRGWNTMSRAGGRAGSENSLTQQLGKWVCSLTRSTALAACGQRRPDSRRLPRAGGGGGVGGEGGRTAGSPAPAPACRAGPPRGRLRIPLPARLCVSSITGPPARAEQARLPPPPALGRGALLVPPGRCGLAYSFCVPSTVSPKAHHSGRPLEVLVWGMELIILQVGDRYLS